MTIYTASKSNALRRIRRSCLVSECRNDNLLRHVVQPFFACFPEISAAIFSKKPTIELLFPPGICQRRLAKQMDDDNEQAIAKAAAVFPELTRTGSKPFRLQSDIQ